MPMEGGKTVPSPTTAATGEQRRLRTRAQRGPERCRRAPLRCVRCPPAIPSTLMADADHAAPSGPADELARKRFRAEIRRLRKGGTEELGRIFAEHRDRLRRAVSLRLDRRVQGRVDPSDVIQDAYLVSLRRFEDYVARPDMPPYLWLRFLALERVIQVHRFHLGAQVRAADRDVRLDGDAGAQATSAVLALELAGTETSPSEAAMRAERVAAVERALARLSGEDREVIALRHYEQLTGRETALVLGIGEKAASQRYLRAMARLRGLLHGCADPPATER